MREDYLARMAAVFCLTVMFIVVPVLFVKLYTDYKIELHKQEEIQKLDFLSFEGNRNQAITDNFCVDSEYYFWESD